MGGTHIDGVIIKDGKIIKKVKQVTDKNNLFHSIWNTLESLLVDCNTKKIQRINLSTTISTNAIIENNISPVGMIIQSGPGLNHDFLKCGKENVFISGYVDHRGKVVQDLDREEIKNIKYLFKDNNISSCAVVTKFSTRNPKQEIAIKDYLKEDFDSITMGHSLSGKLNFPRRVYTAYLNAAVYNTFHNFSKDIKKSLKRKNIEAPLFILKADGGTMDIDTAEKRPVESILSGPAASFMGINSMLSTDKDAILLDIGGTTTDIFFLADGLPLFEPLGIKIDKYKTLVRSIYSLSIGLGGDSSISIEDGEICIGPNRKGSPVGFGGPVPTPTDAMITLGLIKDGNKDKSYESMKYLGAKLGLTPEEIAQEILEVMGDIIKNQVHKALNHINNRPVYTIKELLQDKKVEPRLVNIIGGPARVLVPILEKKFQLPVYYPENYHIANAIGAALAKPTMEINMIADTERMMLSVPELELYENINKNFNISDAKEKSINLIKSAAENMGYYPGDTEVEIVEESSFSMVKGYTSSGKNIRVKTQIMPGLIYKIRGDEYDKS